MRIKKRKLALIGSNGIPANYGGTETFYEFLTKELSVKYDITVYCSKIQDKKKYGNSYLGAKLVYIPLSANGWQAVFYDSISIIDAAFHSDVLLLFGSPAAALVAFLRAFGFKKKIVLNCGGLNEWERESYSSFARKYIRFNRRILKGKVIHVVDNELYKQSLKDTFGIDDAIVIRYGGDQVEAIEIDGELLEKYPFLNDDYYVAVARAQVDNNLHIMLEAFARMPDKKLVLVSNFKVSEYGQKLYNQYKDKYPNMILIPGIYEKRELNAVRSNAKVYIHSHSRCGTPPSLCEAMNLGLPIISFDTEVNHEVTKDFAYFFKNKDELIDVVCEKSDEDLKLMAEKSLAIAKSELTWKRIGEQYAKVFEN